LNPNQIFKDEAMTLGVPMKINDNPPFKKPWKLASGTFLRFARENRFNGLLGPSWGCFESTD